MDNSVSAWKQVIDWFELLTGSAGSVLDMINSLSFTVNGHTLGVWTLLTFGGLTAFLVVAFVKWGVSLL